MTVKLFRGISTSMFFRLCWRAPCTVIRSSIWFLTLGVELFIFAGVVRPLQLRYNKPVRKCGHCGSSGLKRVHRTFLERFSYLAIYECRDCENEQFVPRRYTYHLGEQVRCPGCGTYRVT